MRTCLLAEAGYRSDSDREVRLVGRDGGVRQWEWVETRVWGQQIGLVELNEWVYTRVDK